MRYLLRRPLLAAFGLVATLAPGARAFLGHRATETVYVQPTGSILTVPTSYVVPSTYVWPTTYVSPTVYTSSLSTLTPTYYVSPTSYVVPTYRTTSYLAPRRVVGRPIITTTRSYLPTVYSTAWDLPVVMTSGSLSTLDCDSAPVVTSPAPAQAAPAPRNGSQGAGKSTERPSSVIDSVPANEPPLQTEPRPSATFESNTQGPATNPPPPPGPAPEAPGDSQQSPPPVAPTGPAETLPQTGSTGVAPDSGGAGGLGRFNVQRPRYADPDLRPASSTNGILEGKVISTDSGRAEADVRVILSDHRGRFDDRIARTDALGRYAINLPEGDWTVRVEMPSRRTFEVARITVSNGRISTANGRDVTSLTINR